MSKKTPKPIDGRVGENQNALSSEAARRLLNEMHIKQTQLETLNDELRRAHAATEASQEHYFDFYNAAPVGYLTLTINSMIIEANLTMASLLGVSRESLIRQQLISYVYHEDKVSFHTHIKQLFLTGASEAFEFRILTKIGTTLWIRMEALLMRSADNQELCHAVISEITELKTAEETLRESEAKYRQLFDIESDALFLIDSQSGKLLEANLAAVSLYGYSRAELLTMRHVDLSAEPAETEKATVAAGSSGTVVIPLRYHRKKDGTKFPVEINSASLLWKGRPAIMPAIRDISERMRADAAIHRNAMVQTILREITEAAMFSSSLEELYRELHRLIGRVLMARNFRILLLDEASGQIVTVFGTDETTLIPVQRLPGRYMADYIMRQNQAVYVTSAEFERLQAAGEVDDRFVEWNEWLGAPLFDSKRRAFGAVALFSLANEQQFQPDDIEVFSIIAAQISLVIERKRAEEAQRRSMEIQIALREIADAATTIASLDDLYKKVHQSVKKVLPASVFYVELIDEEKKQVLISYCGEEMCLTPGQRPLGKGLAEYVVNLGRVVYAKQVELKTLFENGEISLPQAPGYNYLGAPLKDSTGRSFGVIAINTTVSLRQEDVEVFAYIAAQIAVLIERKQIEIKLRESEKRFRAIVENATDIIYSLSLEGIITYISPNWRQNPGDVISELVGYPITKYMHPDDQLAWWVFFKRCKDTGVKQSDIEYRVRHKDGAWHWHTSSLSPMRDLDSATGALIGIDRDINDRKLLEEELRLQATTDGLTGIFNRRYFLMRAEEELQRIRRYGGKCALLMVDIDHFKEVNDNFGHDSGDVVLKMVANLCRDAMRTIDLLGRVGGEEFAILLLETSVQEAVLVANRLRQSIQDNVFKTEDQQLIRLRVSIGVAEHYTTEESLNALMVRADKALYRAKNEGRNRVNASR